MEQDVRFENKITAAALTSVYRRTGRRFVPAAVSNHHVHLSKTDFEILFGAGAELKAYRPLVQPGQFAAEQKVSLAGPKGRIDGIRVLGPLRKETQIELSVTDTYKVGIHAEPRMSGELAGSPGARLETEKGAVDVGAGVIVAARHLHMSDGQAKAYGLVNGQTVSLKKAGAREIVFGNFIVRSGVGHTLEAHFDTDEANAALIRSGEFLEVLPG